MSGGTIIILGALVVGFFAIGGLEGVKDFGTRAKGTVKGLLTIPEAAAISPSEANGEMALIQTNVVGQRKNGNGITTTIRLSEIDPALQTEVAKSLAAGSATIVRGGTILLDQPTAELTRTLSGTGTAQFSTGQVGILTEAKIQEIAQRELTTQQMEDIAALELRRQESAFSNVKLSGAEVVFQKALQEELSKSLLTSQFGGQTFVGGKLFANPLFETGGQ